MSWAPEFAVMNRIVKHYPVPKQLRREFDLLRPVTIGTTAEDAIRPCRNMRAVLQGGEQRA
jgi:hypothetical protein